MGEEKAAATPARGKAQKGVIMCRSRFDVIVGVDVFVFVVAAANAGITRKTVTSNNRS